MSMYEYVKGDAFPEQLKAEIEADENITTGLDYIYCSEPEYLRVCFVSDLSQDEKTALDSVVSAHTPSYPPIPENWVLISDGTGYYTWGPLSTLSGTLPTEGWQIATKGYTDYCMSTVSGTIEEALEDVEDTWVFDFAIRDASKEYFEVNATDWTVVVSFPFPGTDVVEPSIFQVVSSRDGTDGFGECRLFDYTNNQEICYLSWQQVEKSVYHTHTLSNLASGAVVLEVQIKKDYQQANKVRVHSCVLR